MTSTPPPQISSALALGLALGHRFSWPATATLFSATDQVLENVLENVLHEFFFIKLPRVEPSNPDVLRSETPSEAKVLKHVLKYVKGIRRDTKRSTSMRKWLVKNLKIDGLHASLCQTSWSTSLGCPAGEYEFIEVLMNEEEDENGGSERQVMDIDFRSQFELARQLRGLIAEKNCALIMLRIAYVSALYCREE